MTVLQSCKGVPHIMCQRCYGFHPLAWKCDRGACCELDRQTRQVSRPLIDRRRQHQADTRRSHPA